MSRAGFTADDVTDQSGRTFLVTGANTGLGFATSKVLAARGARVLLGCRSGEKAHAAMAQIRAEVRKADIEWIPLDLADLASVRSAAQQVSYEPRLDVLVNNAGIMMTPRELTRDGFESQFGVNHLGTFALTALLLDKLAEQAGSRVVVTSSIAHNNARIFFDDINAEKTYSRVTRYQMTKLANLLFMYELDRRLRKAAATTIAVGCHPGIADTELMRYMPSWARGAAPLMRRLFNSANAGAWPTLMAATATGIQGGDYLGPSKRMETAGPARHARASATSRDPELGHRLWELSIDMTGIDPGI